MRIRQVLPAAAAFLSLFAAPHLPAQEGKAPHPTAGKEHEFLKQFEGEWETSARLEFPEGKMHEMQGTESACMMMGHFWLAFVDHSTMEDKPFLGHGLIGYDPAKGKYVGIWVDCMSPYLTTFEGTADPTLKKLTLESSGTDPRTKKACKGRMIHEIQDRDHRTLRFFREEEIGSEKLIGEVHYTRNAPDPKDR